MYKDFGIRDDVLNLSCEVESLISSQIKSVNEICEYNSMKVLRAFHNNKVSETHFNSTTGYGYGDIGRDVIERIYADIFQCEDALVRSQFISGSHALTVCLFALLRPGDVMLSITGKPYDTLDEVIGLKDNDSSLKSFGIGYEQIDLIDDEFDVDSIITRLKNSPVKLIEIQRSKGYSTRKSITIDKVRDVISQIRKVDRDVIIMIDNCYCEFVDKLEPTQVGADVCVGSLIKNLGGGIAPNGAYIVGRSDLIKLCGERLTLPGEGCEVGPTLGINKFLVQGLFFAPSVVASSLKTAIFTSCLLEKLGYNVEPKYDEVRADIVQNIIFGNSSDLISYCQGIQYASPIDSFVTAEAWDMPGYSDKVIMAAGTFTQGSSIELSCDGPIRSPFIAYQQGSLTYEYGRLSVMKAVSILLNGKV